jgi:streptogramin lyase
MRETKVSGAVICTVVMLMLAASAHAANAISGQVLGAGTPIANSTVTLWAATAGAPQQLAQTRSGDDGRFSLNAAAGGDNVLYLVATGGQAAANKARGDNPAIALLSVLGSTPPANVVINEFTTIASVWTNNQFIDGTAIKGPPLGLKIAAGNVPNFVDLATGGYGVTILDALNSAQTPTMANFATLASILAACVTELKPDACGKFFDTATSPIGASPHDTLAATENIVRYPSHQAEKIFALLNDFYPVPKFEPGKLLRPTPFLPYLNFAPSAWIFPLKFTGGGLSGAGKLMFDSEGNVWLANNFIVGAQNQDSSWTGTLSKFSPSGKALSPDPLGFTGGGIAGPGFGLTIDASDNVWVDSFTGQTISEFDKTGQPLSPAQGWNFGGKISQMQGIIATPNGDIWAVDTIKAQILHLPKGDPSKVEFYCQNTTGDPLKNPCKLLAPFAIAIDQQDRIWVTNVGGDTVSRFPASDPSKVEALKAGYSGTGIAVDTLGNVWISNKLGSSERGHLKLIECLAAFKINFDGDPDAGARLTKVLVPAMAAQTPGFESGGSVTVFRPDGTQASFSPVYGKGLFTPWAVSIDGDDNIWVSNFASSKAGIVELCGFRPEHCPPGMKTGDAISPPGGYVGGGLQMQIDLGIGPAGDVWVDNNWWDYQAALGQVAEPLSTLGSGQGVVVFYGMAKPVTPPLIGPVRHP